MDNTPAMPRSVADIISDKLRTEFVSLVTDDQWRKIVEDQYHNYMVLKTVGPSNDRRTRFEQDVHDALRAKSAEIIKAALSGPDMFPTWDNLGHMVPSEAAKAIAEKHAVTALQHVMTEAIALQMTNLRHSLSGM